VTVDIADDTLVRVLADRKPFIDRVRLADLELFTDLDAEGRARLREDLSKCGTCVLTFENDPHAIQFTVEVA